MNHTDKMSLENHLDRLFGRINFERHNTPRAADFKLTNMLELARRLGNPHLAYPVVHVAGTKGKGSVCTFMGAVLSASGKRTGVYTSPHLETINQRIAIDGQIIEDGQLLELLNQMQPVIEEMDCRATELDCEKLTFFEVITAAAMLHFANQKVEAVILEVGMGGRLDSTNICQPDLSVITNISLDHTQQLGDTVDRIAREKAGIIKPGVPVVSGAVHPEVIPVIAETAKRCSAELFVMGQDFHCHPATEANSMAEDSQRPGEYAVANWFHASGLIRNVGYELRDLEIAVFGHHQQLNASLATAAVQVLAADGWPINAQHVRQGLQTAQLDGRTEILTRDPTIVVDLAHNVASATALAETLQWKVPGFATAGCRRLIFAASREKDVQGMLEPLARIFDQICLTQFTSNPRGMPVQQLAQIAGQVSNPAETEWLTMPDSRSAWQWCRKIMGKEDFTCITGSVFLVAELRPRILQIANDR